MDVISRNPVAFEFGQAVLKHFTAITPIKNMYSNNNDFLTEKQLIEVKPFH